MSSLLVLCLLMLAAFGFVVLTMAVSKLNRRIRTLESAETALEREFTAARARATEVEAAQQFLSRFVRELPGVVHGLLSTPTGRNIPKQLLGAVKRDRRAAAGDHRREAQGRRDRPGPPHVHGRRGRASRGLARARPRDPDRHRRGGLRRRAAAGDGAARLRQSAAAHAQAPARGDDRRLPARPRGADGGGPGGGGRRGRRGDRRGARPTSRTPSACSRRWGRSRCTRPRATRR